jgi:hypothetical protein
LVLDATGAYGDDVEWSVRDSLHHVLQRLSVADAIQKAGDAANWVIETTAQIANVMEADARAMALDQGGMDDNVRDLWQTAISLRAELDAATPSLGQS